MCRASEFDLADELAATQAAAQQAADLAVAKEAEQQLAMQQWEAECAKGTPIEQVTVKETEQGIQGPHNAMEEKVRAPNIYIGAQYQNRSQGPCARIQHPKTVPWILHAAFPLEPSPWLVIQMLRPATE